MPLGKADIDPAPTVAAIRAAQQRADIALKTGPGRDPQPARRTRHRANVAAVDLAFGVERLQRNVPPMLAAVGAAEQAGAAGRIDRAGTPAADQHAVHVDRIVVDILAVAQILPVFAAIARAEDAADLDRRIDQIGIADI